MYYSDSARMVGNQLVADSESIYVSGYAYSLSYGLQITKLNHFGKVIWNKRYGLCNSTRMIKTKDGNLLIGGFTQQNAVILKLDTSGDVLWSNQFKNSEGIWGIAEGNNQEIILMTTSDFNYGFYGMKPRHSIIVLDSAGNFLKGQYFGGPIWWSSGDIKRTTDGGFILIETETNFITIAKLDSSYNFSWIKNLKVSTGFLNGSDIMEVADGYVYSGRISQQLMLGKIDKLGNLKWNKAYPPLRTIDNTKLALQDGRINLTSMVYFDSSNVPVYMSLLQADSDGNVIISKINSQAIYGFFSVDTKRIDPESWISMTQYNDSFFELFKTATFGESNCLNDFAVKAVISSVNSVTMSDTCSMKDSLMPIVVLVKQADAKDSLICGEEIIPYALNNENIIVIPNVFTPNGDGVNDAFQISDDNLKSYQCEIFNRWGESVYKLSAESKKWDGKGCVEGTYFYVVRGEYLDHTDFSASGSLMLLR